MSPSDVLMGHNVLMGCFEGVIMYSLGVLMGHNILMECFDGS